MNLLSVHVWHTRMYMYTGTPTGRSPTVSYHGQAGRAKILQAPTVPTGRSYRIGSQSNIYSHSECPVRAVQLLMVSNFTGVAPR